MVPGPTARALDDLAGVLRAQHHDGSPDRDLDVVAERALASAQGAGDESGHAEVALQLVDGLGIAAADLDVGHEARDGRERDARFTQRGEHVLDVVQEQRVRSDHQHALTLERRAMGEEKVRGAVKGDRGLAGSRTALDEEHAGEWVADDPVLLALDRGDDVTHPTGARAS